MEGELGDEIGEERSSPGTSRLASKTWPAAIGWPSGARPAARRASACPLTMSSSVVRAVSGTPDVGSRAQVVADLAGRAVPPGQHLAAGHDGGREPGAEVQVDGRVDSRPAHPSAPRPGRPPCVGGHVTGAPGNAARSSRPKASSSQPLIAGASSTRSSNGIPKVETPTAARCAAARRQRSRAAAMPRSKPPGAELAAAGDGGRREPRRWLAGIGDLGAAEVEPEHDGGGTRFDMPVCAVSAKIVSDVP